MIVVPGNPKEPLWVGPVLILVVLVAMFVVAYFGGLFLKSGL